MKGKIALPSWRRKTQKAEMQVFAARKKKEKKRKESKLGHGACEAVFTVFARCLTINALQLLFILTQVPQSSRIRFENGTQNKSKRSSQHPAPFNPMLPAPSSPTISAVGKRGRAREIGVLAYLDGGGLLPPASNPSWRSKTGGKQKE